MKITLIKTLSGFKLAYNSDHELSKKIPLNDPIEYEWKKPRNYNFHKKFFALINLVYENQETFKNIDHLRKELTIASGFYETYYDMEGIEKKEALSISFAKMDEAEFSELYNRFVDVVVNWLNIDKQDIIDNIEQYF